MASLCLLLTGCGAARASQAVHEGRTGTPGRAAAAKRPCAGTIPLNAGSIVSGRRIGAVDFLSGSEGVGATAPWVWCSAPRGPVERFQTVRLALSRDGGRTWTAVGAVPPDSAAPGRQGAGATETLFAVSPARAWLLTARGRLVATRSAGTRWAVQPLPAPVVALGRSRHRLWALSCLPAGTYTCRPVLDRMRLPAGRWVRLPIPRVRLGLGPRMMVASDRGVVISGIGGRRPATLLASGDGGERWTQPPLPRWQGRRCAALASLTSAGPRTWWLLCLGNAAAGSSTKALLRTRDAGRTWAIVSSVDMLTARPRAGAISSGEPDELAAASGRKLWLALYNGIESSDDGGSTWRPVPLRSVDQYGSASTLDVLSPRRAWLLAPGTGLWTTADGRSWHATGGVQVP